jgi:para-nitrobenzyl esterase
MTTSKSIILAMLCCVIPLAAGAPLRQTLAGPVQGLEQDGILSFKGIPYAASPTGHLRWQPPAPVQPWKAARKADDFGPACPQAEPIQPQSEDCLSLNLWTPARADGKLPVAVWIHGGAGIAGGSRQRGYDGANFARDGVILVSINYRIGRLGFFAYDELEGKGGNFGYMDMVAALRWVRDNIASFGGDPGRVTIFGESSGAMAVTALMTMPEARGLFAAAIAESGGEGQMSPLADAIAAGQRFAASVGARDLAELRALPASAIVGQLGYDALGREVRDGLFGSVMLDGRTLREQPGQVFKQGREAQVPYLSGANSREEAPYPPEFYGSQAAEAELSRLLQAYPAQAAAARIVYDLEHVGAAETLVQILSDSGYVEAARYYARQHRPSWSYRFSYVASKDRATLPGAPHASEIAYVFDNLDAAASTEDKAVGAAVHGAWVRFMKQGDPGWASFNGPDEPLMDFGVAGSAAGPDPRRARLDVISSAKGR